MNAEFVFERVFFYGIRLAYCFRGDTLSFKGDVMKKIVLYLERDDIHGMVLESSKNGYALLEYISDPAKLAEYMRLTKIEPLVCADVFSSVRSTKTKETIGGRKAATELLTEKKTLPGDDVWWDFAQLKGWLNVFSVKKATLSKLWEIHADFSLDERELVLKPAALYDYAVWALDGKVSDFSVLNLSASLFNYLVVAGGRIFYVEIPGMSTDDVVDEIKRTIEYLQVQEGVKSDVFQRIYSAVESEELRARLSDKIKRELVPLPEKVLGTDRLAGRKGYLPLAVGTMLAQSRGDRKMISLKVNTMSTDVALRRTAADFWRRHGLAAMCAVAVVCVVIDGLLLRNISELHGYVSENRERTQQEIPAFLAATKENGRLKKLEETVMSPVNDHLCVVDAIATVAEYLGPVTVTEFDYLRDGRKVVLGLESVSYDAVSVFLKKVRESKLFAAVTPVSSETAKTGGKESVRFKVELVI